MTKVIHYDDSMSEFKISDLSDTAIKRLGDAALDDWQNYAVLTEESEKQLLNAVGKNLLPNSIKDILENKAEQIITYLEEIGTYNEAEATANDNNMLEELNDILAFLGQEKYTLKDLEEAYNG